MEEMNESGILQILLKNGVNVQIGVRSLSEYKIKKDSILKSTKDFVTIIDACTVRREDISLIEFCKYDTPTLENKPKKGGLMKWLKR